MFIHHIMTILLISISWTTNFFRVGTLVLWVHDQADVWIDAAKMFKYVGKDAIADPLFYTFGAMWVITRLGVYPTWILYSFSAEAPNFVQGGGKTGRRISDTFWLSLLFHPGPI